MTRHLRTAICVVVFLPLVLMAQAARERDPAPLKYWSAPLYWQPTTADVRGFATPAATTTNLPANANPLVFVAMTPCRVVDTRVGQGFSNGFGPPSLVGGASRTFSIQSSATCPTPTIAQAYSFNITVVPPGSLGFITAYPTGQKLPLAATLNDVQGLIVGNAAIVPAGTNGSIDIFASGPTDIVIDMNGYYASITDDSSANSALGLGALASNTTGSFNTASGNAALHSNTTGSFNTANGSSALANNTTGSSNTATGGGALVDNTTGSSNTASGARTLESNSAGSFNTGYGNQALFSNTSGNNNTAIGFVALFSNVAGNNNIAIGPHAAQNVSDGNSNNIHIGNVGFPNDSGFIRIGTPGTQSSFFAAGVRGVTTGTNNAVPVVIDSNGQLGTISSSIRFKEDVQNMAEASSGLLRLRPVTYRYKQPYADGSKPLDYGLIAEEVADVYPDLVAKGADGQIETVQYQKLTPMLLNEVQKQHEEILRQQELNRKLEARLAALEALLSSRPPSTPEADQ